MDYSIESHGLTKIYNGQPVVNRLNLRIERGTFCGFLGPNGAGKSTTIKMLTGVLAPSSGYARILGNNLKHDTLAIKKRIGVVPEDQCLFENLTAPEYLVFIGRMYGLPKDVALDRSHELLDALGLADASKTLILEFSTGMKKKLALCAALIHDPEILFLDEPFEGVDAIASRTIRAVLEQARARGATIFLTSHILEIVERLCSHVYVIHEGQLIFQGSLETLAQGSRLDEAFLKLVAHGQKENTQLSWLGASH
ncbi:MAG: ABC transporter ATP-binding protein [Candidatus Hydrogenedentales bacterium]|jgi:ABC-2 type transport system ATP-binding protein